MGHRVRQGGIYLCCHPGEVGIIREGHNAGMFGSCPVETVKVIAVAGKHNSLALVSKCENVFVWDRLVCVSCFLRGQDVVASFAKSADHTHWYVLIRVDGCQSGCLLVAPPFRINDRGVSRIKVPGGRDVGGVQPGIVG